MPSYRPYFQGNVLRGKTAPFAMGLRRQYAPRGTVQYKGVLKDFGGKNAQKGLTADRRSLQDSSANFAAEIEVVIGSKTPLKNTLRRR